MIDEERAEQIGRRCLREGAEEASVDRAGLVVTVVFRGLRRPGGEPGSIWATVTITEALAEDVGECARYVMTKAKEKRDYLLRSGKDHV